MSISLSSRQRLFGFLSKDGSVGTEHEPVGILSHPMNELVSLEYDSWLDEHEVKDGNPMIPEALTRDSVKDRIVKIEAARC